MEIQLLESPQSTLKLARRAREMVREMVRRLREAGQIAAPAPGMAPVLLVLALLVLALLVLALLVLA